MAKNIYLILVGVLVFVALRILAADSDRDFLRSRASQIGKTEFSLTHFELSSPELSSEGCDQARPSYDKVQPNQGRSTLVLDHCIVGTKSFSEPISLVDVESVGDLYNGVYPGYLVLHNASFHFDEDERPVVDEEKHLVTFALRCAPSAETAYFARLLKYYKYSISCSIEDFLGAQVGTLHLTEI